MSFKEERDAYLASATFAATRAALPFCRLWCTVEIYSADRNNKPIIFRMCTGEVSETGHQLRIGFEGGKYTLLNFSVSCVYYAIYESKQFTLNSV